MSIRTRLILLVFLVSFPTGACSDPAEPGMEIVVTVQPEEVEVEAGGVHTFNAIVRNASNSGVTWSVSGGEFTAAGPSMTWTAPQEPGAYTITTASVVAPEKKASATAVVIRSEPEPYRFDAYRGTAATLPEGMFVRGVDGLGNPIGPGFDPFTGVSDLGSEPPDAFDGFGAFTNGGYSFGIRERGEVDLRDARLFLRYVNTSDEHIIGFDVSFDVEVWLQGERANRIRLKFSTDTIGFGDLPDIVSVTNPRGRARGDAVGRRLDGTLPENRARVSMRFSLTDLLGPGGEVIGSLAPGDTGYFRWQYSNAEGDAGQLRSALALSNIQITPVHGEPPPPASGLLEFSHQAGFYTEPFHLTLGSSLPNATIYYTVDGSEPDPGRVMDDATWAALPVETRARTFVYTGPIDIGALVERADEITLIPTGDAHPPRAWRPPLGESFKGAVVRAIVMRGSTASPSVTKTYFVAPEGAARYSLPVVSLATDRSNLFSPESGIHVPGSSGSNYEGRGEAWERAAHFEFFVNGARVVAQGVGIRIHGGFTRRFAQKALRISAREQYGESRLRYRFFDSKTQEEFKSVILRAGGNDNSRTHIRDGVLQMLVQHLSFETQHYQPIILFINGEYWGLHGLRDRYDDHHLSGRYGLDRSGIVIPENDSELVAGDAADAAAYRDFRDRLKSGALSSRTAVDAEMDLDGYLDYVIAQMYAGNTDWPQSNIKYWRYKGPRLDGNGYSDGRWRWLMYDVDRSFGKISSKTTNMVHHLFISTTLPWAKEFFRAVMAIPGVRDELLQRAAVHLETTFHPDRVRAHIDSIAWLVRPEIEEHIRRWTRPGSLAGWQSHVDVMYDFAAERPTYIRQHVIDRFEEVTGTAELTIAGVREEYGLSLHTIRLSERTPGVRITGGVWSGELFTGIPVVLKAEGVDLTGAAVSGAATQVERDQGRLSFTMTGPVRIDLP